MGLEVDTASVYIFGDSFCKILNSVDGVQKLCQRLVVQSTCYDARLWDSKHSQVGLFQC